GPVTADPRLQPETAERFEAPRILDPAEAARHLRATAATSALFLSPEEDEAASIAVRVAREVSDTGRRVVLLDLTVNAAASGPMLEGIRHDGITDLLAAEAQ